LWTCACAWAALEVAVADAAAPATPAAMAESCEVARDAFLLLYLLGGLKRLEPMLEPVFVVLVPFTGSGKSRSEANMGEDARWGDPIRSCCAVRIEFTAYGA
jgi:hypothetical protein